jgi:hypothetical protein
MEEIDSKLPPRKKYGHLAKSGLWSVFNTDKLDRRTRLSMWIEKKKAALIRELGGSLSVQQEILVDRVCVKMAKCHLYEMGVLCNPPKTMGSKDFYLALSNSLRLDLQVLFPDGLKKQGKKITDLNDYLKSKKEVQDGND